MKTALIILAIVSSISLLAWEIRRLIPEFKAWLDGQTDWDKL